MKTMRIPTFVDVHVHLREPGATQKEDFETGTRAAIAGGYTQILDMPNNTPPTVSTYKLQEKNKLAHGRIWCDVGFNFGASTSSANYFSKVKNQVFALKVYMNQTTGTLLMESNQNRELIFKKWLNPQPIMVHAEGETIEIAVKLAEKYKRKLHVCHITYDQIPTIRKAKRSGLDISCEVCPHHLFLCKEGLKELGSFGVMKPPLLPRSQQTKLWGVLDDIDMISTDHAPHTIDEKLDQYSPKYGVPGLETTLPLMFWAVKRKFISQQRVLKMLTANPKRIFNLPDQPNTYMDVDMKKEYKIGEKILFTKCQWTPFKDHNGVGEIKRVVLRGKTIFNNGTFIGKPQGNLMRPKY